MGSDSSSAPFGLHAPAVSPTCEVGLIHLAHGIVVRITSIICKETRLLNTTCSVCYSYLF